jgi:hypothetical protein
MNDNKLDPEKFVEAIADWLDIDLSAASLETVEMHLSTAARLAQLVLDFPLDDEAEPAPVFTA